MHEANRILRSVKSALAADGNKLPPSAETDGLMMLLDRLDCDKFLSPKIKHARSAAPGSSAYKRMFTYLAFFRALSAYKSGISDPVTTVSLTMLHKYVCGDLDKDAGKPRQSEFVETGGAHTDPKYITGSVKSIITKMNDIPSSPDIGKEDFAGYLTHYMRELIILHPFMCGSAFTVRLFIMMFCKIKGFALCYYRVAPSAIKDAENAAFIADDITPLYKIFTDCLSYERTTEVKRTAPKTRREIGRETASIPSARKLPARHEANLSAEHEADAREDADDLPGDGRKNIPEKTKAAKKQADPDVLKRAIKLQQKITKLNEQLTELMSESKDH